MSPVCVLGNGQLGRMLRQAGEPLGIAVYPIGLDAEPESVPYQSSIITAEIERWPETALTRELAHHKAFINREIFPQLADRLPQKQLMDTLGLATASWKLLSAPSQWSQLFGELGDFIIVKRRTGGYDGRGQWRIRPGDEIELPAELYGDGINGACIAEQGIPFSGEVSLVGARNAQGKSVFYPLTHNLHQEGILRTSVAFPTIDHPLRDLHLRDHHLQQQAEKMLSRIMDHLNYIGVMAMECFIVGDDLLINELAPRVHNSGHWTQNGASISQFELHLRAILDLPMPQPEILAPSVMVNLIGTEINPEWLSLPLVHLHWYDKEVRPMRKVGHLNLVHPDRHQLKTALQTLIPLLPEEYRSGLKWAQGKLS
ncbi:MAG: 5-(carboxyamino)imidazole ribonucleotide synthase [Enterobacteriaceae bacterium]|jgi:5-(carboxyamino)imidazole ribonucleotide synthase|nr:5-(carboxyamino)imidazole ribonucleotide synthase [Enterobacteriaceae bacterium]